MWLLEDDAFDSVIFNSSSEFFSLALLDSFLTLKMTLNVVDNDIIECAVLNNPHIDPELFLQPF